MNISKVIFSCLVVILLITGCSQEAESTVSSTKPGAAATQQEEAFVWKVSTPKEQGVDEQLLGKIEEQLRTKHTKIKSLLILKNGQIIYEKYTNEAYRDTPTAVYSVTKSVMSALTGIAIEQKQLSDVDQKLSELLAEEMSNQSDSAKKEITILNALTMTGGLNSSDIDINAYFRSGNFIQYALDQPMIDPTKTKFIYNTGLTHLLSGAITKATGLSTKAFADQSLFGPMGITHYRWLQDPQGIYVGGTNLFLTPRDMAKFGYLYLHEGVWDNQQLIPKDWVKRSIEKQVKVEDNVDYGYLFWLTTMENPQGKELFTYEANGYGGQHIRVIPDLDSVIVVTSDESSQEQSDANDLVEKYIIPALGEIIE